jgi:hypothetical protein
MGMQGTRVPGIFVARATFILLPTMPDLCLTFFWLHHFEARVFGRFYSSGFVLPEI